jgi:ribosomal protein S18 acetylase RimI-like enzyme
MIARSERSVDILTAFQIRSPSEAESECITAIARDAKVFSAEEIEVVQELVEEHFEFGAERSGYHFVIAGDEREVFGFACYGPRPLTIGTFDLYWIVVAPDSGQRGVGSALLERVIAEVRAAGGRLLVAETSSLPAYGPARAFYDRHDFARAATIQEFYAPGEDLVIFVRRLG